MIFETILAFLPPHHHPSTTPGFFFTYFIPTDKVIKIRDKSKIQQTVDAFIQAQWEIIRSVIQTPVSNFDSFKGVDIAFITLLSNPQGGGDIAQKALNAFVAGAADLAYLEKDAISLLPAEYLNLLCFVNAVGRRRIERPYQKLLLAAQRYRDAPSESMIDRVAKRARAADLHAAAYHALAYKESVIREGLKVSGT